MDYTTQITKPQPTVDKRLTKTVRPLTGGIPVHTDLRAGLAWDDLDDKAQELFNTLSNTLSGLISGESAG